MATSSAVQGCNTTGQAEVRLLQVRWAAETCLRISARSYRDWATSFTDGLVRFSPPVQRAVQETVDALREEGHECVEFAVPDVLEMARVFVALTSADRYQTLTSHVGPDPRVSMQHCQKALLSDVHGLQGPVVVPGHHCIQPSWYVVT